MRSGLGLIGVLLLSACADDVVGPPQDCAVAKANFWECMDRYQTVDGDVVTIDFEAMWYACIPHSEPKRIGGWWATDFEMSDFFEGKEPTFDEVFPDEMTMERAMQPDLSFKEGVEAPPTSENRSRLWAVTFIGREEICQMFPEIPPTIFVEKVLDQELVWEAQGYPTYTGEKFAP